VGAPVAEPVATAAPGRRRTWRVALGGLLAVLALLTIGELAGWPFLAAPLQQQLSARLDRRVQISRGPGFAVRFVGHPRLRAAQLEVAAPDWSAAPHLLLAQDIELEMRWIDLWRAAQGQRLRIQRLQAAMLDVHLERQLDGRASWTLGRQPAAGAPPAELPLVGSLLPGRGLIHVQDQAAALELKARLTRESDAASSAVQWQLQADGRLRQLPLKIELDASSDGAAAVPEGSLAPLHLKLKALVGRGQFEYTGYVHDLLQGAVLDGRFKLQGPSLAAVGDLIGVTLPTTAAFSSRGTLVKQGSRWRVQVDDATIGASRLDGRFVYAGGRGVPLLTGRLGGSQLMLRDLGPVVGTTAVAAPVAAPASASASASAAASAPPPPPAPGRVLPVRPFDLASLRAMDAMVDIDIQSVDLNTSLLQPLRPLQARLELKGGVLSLNAVDARTAQGRLTGQLGLDGRGDQALWTADLRWSGLRLEQWIKQERAGQKPPWASGRLDGRLTVQGEGRSTAEILAHLTGSARSELLGGTVSQLAIEAAGLDVAESLGLLITGDEVLPVTCAVADLVAERGVWRTRTLVLDTPDSTLWVDGTVSLASEAMDLRVVVSPKDLSPLALRSPLRLRGSLAHPDVSIEKGALGRKLATSLLLGLLNPLAALIPLVDTGSAAVAGRGGADCQRLLRARPVGR
jgi:AsmA family protein